VADFSTPAELIMFRDLEVETRSGVPHFKIGQHKARIVGGMAQLTYVDVGGNACMIILVKRDGEWFLASPTGIRAGHFVVEIIHFPRYFRVTEDMQKALAATEKEQAQKKGRRPGTRTRTTPSDGG